MEYARLEVRFVPGGWSSGTLITGLAGVNVRGVLVRPFDLVVTHTLLKGSGRRLRIPTGAQVVGNVGAVLPEGNVRLVRGASVTQGGKRVGRVSAVWCDRATGHIMHVLVRPEGGLLRRPPERVLSADEVSELTSEGLLLGAGTTPIKALTTFRPDREIEADLRIGLAEALPAPNARRAVKLLVETGVVHVGGLVETEQQVSAARQAVSRVRGIRTLEMDLVSIETLGARVERQLAAVLAENGVARAAGAGVRVLAEHGIIYLEGSVPSKELRRALERAAQAVPGVKVVMNSLEVAVDPKGIPQAPARQVDTSLAEQVGDEPTADEPPVQVGVRQGATSGQPSGDLPPQG
jgi:osmotically-inducible protein OsmY